MRLFLTISTIMSIVLVSCLTVLDTCRTWAEARLEISGTPWEIIRRSHSCGWFDGGMTYIVAKNRASREVLHVVDIDGYADVGLSIDDAKRLVVNLYAPIELSNKRDSFDGISVTYESKAQQPGDAEAYRLWLDHHDDPRAVAWCRSKGWSPFYCEPRERPP
ncbi:MAG TPA: hypothetical protein VGU20_25230 [Stellaceae bacterium]|nr:hypothetical protein [Stellaceae bacterium]